MKTVRWLSQEFTFKGLLLIPAEVLVVAAFAAVVMLVSPDGGRVQPADSPTAVPFVIDNPSLSDDDIEGYWYCWNSGDPAPHHLDHWVPNDHLCTWGELRSSGATR
ncbi:hypothetical protein C3492_36390 [Streptomyces sp. Ru62]|uniref:hypothetical protein n=1 Tax=Streptomyces sp. Ru62 TaxID=2080745 RepID=UPI000CDD6B40|nr:hypothetical protein [Streptomyces sp. Ru62]POX58698.1 hypothetical protein C3492_36390 [Streptomyces sp. Ru62]